MHLLCEVVCITPIGRSHVICPYINIHLSHHQFPVRISCRIALEENLVCNLKHSPQNQATKNTPSLIRICVLLSSLVQLHSSSKHLLKPTVLHQEEKSRKAPILPWASVGSAVLELNPMHDYLEGSAIKINRAYSQVSVNKTAPLVMQSPTFHFIWGTNSLGLFRGDCICMSF